MSEYYSGIKDVLALMGLTWSYLRGARDSYHNLAFNSVEIFNEYLGSFMFKGLRCRSERILDLAYL